MCVCKQNLVIERVSNSRSYHVCTLKYTEKASLLIQPTRWAWLKHRKGTPESGSLWWNDLSNCWKKTLIIWMGPIQKVKIVQQRRARRKSTNNQKCHLHSDQLVIQIGNSLTQTYLLSPLRNVSGVARAAAGRFALNIAAAAGGLSRCSSLIKVRDTICSSLSDPTGSFMQSVVHDTVYLYDIIQTSVCFSSLSNVTHFIFLS